MMKRDQVWMTAQTQAPLIMALVLSSALAVAMTAVRVIHSGSWVYTFLVWNLFLAWIPLAFALVLWWVSQWPRRPWGLSMALLGGWLLFFPLALLAWQQGRRNWQTAVFLPLPLLAPALFIAYRAWLGLPSLAAVYAAHWFQRVGVPGQDVVTAVRLLLWGGQLTSSRFVLAFNLAVAIGLLAGTWLVWRRFGAVYGVYMATMLLFILLPTSTVKPLYSFSRYALAFFPLFWLLGEWGEKRPFVHRLILYTSFLLFLYFSGQFFLGGWVA